MLSIPTHACTPIAIFFLWGVAVLATLETGRLLHPTPCGKQQEENPSIWIGSYSTEIAFLLAFLICTYYFSRMIQ
jgi:hypothetical protein